MAGKPSRSGRPKAGKKAPKGDGNPQSPRILSKRAKKYFAWLVERLGAASDGSPWQRIDGATLASLAELLESEELLATALAGDPFNERLLRLRLQHSDRIYKFSGIVGLTPRDRERLPQAGEADRDAADEWEQG